MPTVKGMPTQDEAFVLAGSLARKMAHQPADVDDLMQEALWAWCDRNKDRIPSPEKPFALMRTVMQRALYSYYSGRWTKSGARHFEGYSLDSLPPMDERSYTHHAGVGIKLDLERFFKTLEQEHGEKARYVAENLVTPKDLFYCRYLSKTSHHKKNVRPNPQKLRKHLKMNKKEWNNMMQRIKEFTAIWLLCVEGMDTLPHRASRFVF